MRLVLVNVPVSPVSVSVSVMPAGSDVELTNTFIVSSEIPSIKLVSLTVNWDVVGPKKEPTLPSDMLWLGLSHTIEVTAYALLIVNKHVEKNIRATAKTKILMEVPS